MFESKLPNTYIFCMRYSLSCFVGNGTRQEDNPRFREPHLLFPVSWEMLRDGKTTWGFKNLMFSLLLYGRWYATGRECEVLRTSHSLLFYGRWYTQGEDVRFFEPHVLSPILWEIIHDRKWYTRGRELEVLRTLYSLRHSVVCSTRQEERMWGSKNLMFSLPFCRRQYATGRERR